MNDIIQIDGLKIIDSNTRIARYFSRSKLIKLMNNQEIWYSNSEHFPDKKERTIPDGFFKGWEEEREENYRIINEAILRSVKSYISCWTKFDEDNYALWKIYDRYSNGACLTTTVGKLQKAISAVRKDMLMCEVEYVDLSDKTKHYERPWCQTANYSRG